MNSWAIARNRKCLSFLAAILIGQTTAAEENLQHQVAEHIKLIQTAARDDSDFLRQRASVLSPHDRERVITSMIPLALGGNGAATEILGAYSDPRTLAALNQIATGATDSANGALRNEIFADRLSMTALDAIMIQIRIDPAAAEREENLFEKVAAEPTWAGFAAARNLQTFYGDDSFLRHLNEMQASKYGNVQRAAAALKTGKRWEQEKAAKELISYGNSSLPSLFDILSTTDDEERRSHAIECINGILKNRSIFYDRESLQYIIAALRQGGPRKYLIAGFLSIYSDMPQAQKEIVELAERDADARVREYAISEIGRPWGKPFNAKLKIFLVDSSERVRCSAASALARHRDDSGHTILRDAVKLKESRFETPDVSTGSNNVGCPIYDAVVSLGQIGIANDIPILEDFSATLTTATENAPLRLAVEDAILQIKIRTAVDKRQRLAIFENTWESSCNEEVSLRLDSMLDSHEMAAYCLDVLKRGTANRCALDKSRDYLVEHGWITKEDRLQPAEQLKLNEKSTNAGAWLWFSDILQRYGPPPPVMSDR